VPRIFSNLNLHGGTPPRVQPTIGEWGPVKVPTTKQKKRMRIWVTLALLGALIAIFLLGWYVYYLMTGSLGFGIGDERQLLAAFLI
jgi:NhaP-type Na+/H+ or K+/H+ antiporter